MTLRHIRIFVTVYQCESITKAAEKLHLAQPSVSLAISELEEYYGLRLFDRMSRRIYVTEAGQQFYHYALHISSLFDEMEKGMKKSGSTGTLKIGAGITIGTSLLPELLIRFRQKHPDFKISALIKNYSAIEEALLSNEIDFALIEGSPFLVSVYRDTFYERPPLSCLRRVTSPCSENMLSQANCSPTIF